MASIPRTDNHHFLLHVLTPPHADYSAKSTLHHRPHQDNEVHFDSYGGLLGPASSDIGLGYAGQLSGRRWGQHFFSKRLDQPQLRSMEGQRGLRASGVLCTQRGGGADDAGLSQHSTTNDLWTVNIT
ncbi:hypothetical protein RvY_18090-3 [Ramazzottius varieornatus]|uniref:Uncharacterized protein n=1 Tax=Ramazzottius varieornatus TaxID=947166 RepID=A0A1D1W4H7_RAMVA|nr:hypothetical protein RvY_18090-3 [Ramazzottius varieornatus]